MKLTRIGVDVAKQVFQVHGVDRHEQPIWRRLFLSFPSGFRNAEEISLPR